MDRKTKQVLNSVTRELFEASTNMPVENPNLPPELAQQLQMKETTAGITNAIKRVSDHFKEAKDIRDQIEAEKHNYEASMLRSEIAAQNIRSRNPHKGPDPALSKLGDFERDYEIRRHNPKTGPDPTLSKMGNAERDYEIRRHNPLTGPDPALGELNDIPWYQQGWQWMQGHPGYTALAAGAPLALAAGAYYLNKRRKGKK